MPEPQTSGRRAGCHGRGICHKVSPVGSTLNWKWGAGVSCCRAAVPPPTHRGRWSMTVENLTPLSAAQASRGSQRNTSSSTSLEPLSVSQCLACWFLRSSFGRLHSLSHVKRDLGSSSCLSLNSKPCPSSSSLRTTQTLLFNTSFPKQRIFQPFDPIKSLKAYLPTAPPQMNRNLSNNINKRQNTN